MSIEVRSVSKTFGEFAALRDVTLVIPEGELVALLGPSGSGKTTLLRIMSGLETPDPGSGGVVYRDDASGREIRERNVGFVFQHYALFRHMTVFENVAFGLRVLPRARRPSRDDIRRRVIELLRLVHLEGLAGRYPAELSGGQRQRIALARCLAVEPRWLLLDEPFGALDAQVRVELRSWLRKLHDEIGLTSVFVTHDQEEAMELADRIVVMHCGSIEQVGTPDDVFHRPASEFVLSFLGNVNLFRGRIEDGKAHFGSLAIDVAGGSSGATAARVFVRPHDFEVALERGPGPSIEATVARIHSAGPRVKLELRSVSGDDVHAELPQDRYRLLGLAVGRRVFLNPREIKVFAGDDYSI